ncbi:hypothetical protein CC79DRAFT_1084569 [Sarocladium strictum]
MFTPPDTSTLQSQSLLITHNNKVIAEEIERHDRNGKGISSLPSETPPHTIRSSFLSVHETFDKSTILPSLKENVETFPTSNSSSWFLKRFLKKFRTVSRISRHATRRPKPTKRSS